MLTPGLSALLRIGRSLADGVLQLVYPQLCWGCGRVLPEDQRSFCGACAQALTGDSHATCPRCSSTIGPYTADASGCPRCRHDSFAFDQALRMGAYDGALREAVLRMKHSSGEGLAEVLARLWASHVGPRVQALHPDLVVPVPLHWTRTWRRGFNQSRILAYTLADFLGVPCRPGCVRRIRRTPQQTHQTPAERWSNVRGAFRCRTGLDLRSKTIVLVDDVLTTGATASEAARALRTARPGRIIVAVVAHG